MQVQLGQQVQLVQPEQLVQLDQTLESLASNVPTYLRVVNLVLERLN
jgi:hypothetical protein